MQPYRSVTPAATLLDRSCRRAITIGLAIVLLWWLMSQVVAPGAPSAPTGSLSVSVLLSLGAWFIVSRTLWQARRLLALDLSSATTIARQ